MTVGNVILPAWTKWVGLAIGLALLVLTACWLNVRYFINPAVNAETARWQHRWDQRDAADKQAEIDNKAQKATLERARQNEIDRIQTDAQNEINRTNALRAAAAANAGRLQRQVEAAIASLRTGQAASATTSGQTGGTTGVLLSELFRELDTAAGQYAAEAKRARDAGLVCERAYDALRAEPKAGQ